MKAGIIKMKIKSPEEYVRNYARGCLEAFINGGKYTKNKKAPSLNWLRGAIRESGVKTEELRKIIKQLKDYSKSEEDRSRFEIIKDEFLEK